MKIKKLSWILLGSMLAVGSLAGCEKKNKKPAEEQQPSGEQGGQQGGGEQGGQQGGEQGGGGQQQATTYTITFKNYDETVLETKSVEEGQTPAYTGQTPVKEGNAQYSYTFEGWDPAIVAASADATYTATFIQSVNSYTVRFVNDDGTELQSETLEYGETPVYKGETPTKEATAQYNYTFSGWDNEIAAVTGDKTYTATYSSQVRSYTVSFQNYDFTLLQTEQLEYGATPVYHEATPEKPSTVDKDFTFAGWNIPIEPVTCSIMYTATFNESTRQYRVDFNYNGGGEGTYEMVNYGQTVAEPTEPTRAADAENIYFFEGWYNGANLYDFNTPITGALTLVAHWHIVSATAHGDRCVWTHHPAKAPDYVNPGYVEFWTCNLHEGYVLAEPAEHYGDILEETEPWADPISNTDERYVAPLEGGNYFARINVGPSNCPGTALPVFRTANAYSHVVGFKLRYRISGAFAEGKSSWMGFYVGAEGKDVYSVYDSTCGGKDVSLFDFDGQWHDVTVRYDGEGLSGYFAFGHALTNFAEGTYVDIDDLVIYGDEIVSEEFERTPSVKLIESEFVKIGGEAKAALPEERNNFMRIRLTNNIDHTFAYSFKPFTNITSIEYDYRLNKEGGIKEGGSSAWFGVKTGASNQDPDSYQESGYIWNVKTANTSTESSYFNGLWTTHSLSGLSTQGFVGFCTCADFKPGSYLDIDNVKIVADGVTYTETFDSIAPLFGCSSKSSYQQYFSYEYEEVISTDKAFDPEKGELVLYNYANKNTLVTENVTDAEKGTCVKIKSLYGYDTIWFGFPQTASNDELLRGLDGKAPTEFYFSVYNSGASDILLQLHYGKDDWNSRPATTFKAGQWTDITLKIDGNITDVSKISYYKWVGGDEDNQVTICDSNAQLTFTAIRVRHVEPSVNPAPFGVVALDAQTGYFRDTKGYNAPHTDSHGIDAEYGAYIQIDDWACPSNANQCWITFSDTARNVADIEADLGGAIQNYFFYIYNPLADSFTFKIMLKSSSGMNPNMTVACASHTWTKVTIAYGQADNGSYPALTSASQIGLTQVLGNGVAVGSGWKVTSVYAE